MSVDKIHYNFDKCKECMENLKRLQEECESRSAKRPQIQSNGIFINEVVEVFDCYENLYGAFDYLIASTNAFICQVSNELKKVDESVFGE